MSRQLDVKIEARMEREREAVLGALYGGLVEAVERAGGVLGGFSVKIAGAECLMTLRAEFPGGHQVAFVGGGDLVDVLIKATREARADALKWRLDKFKVQWLGREGKRR